MKRLENKVAVITGAASGIGLAIAQRFSREGAFVHLLDLQGDAAETETEAIRQSGNQAAAHPCDMTQQQQVVEVLAAIQQLHPINIMVNNAGIGFVGNLEKTAEADFDRLYRVNVKGVYNGLFAAVPLMKTNGGGVILNMASVVASVGIPDRFAYTMTKSAVLGMTLSVALDYLGEGIRCNCISPARIHTPFVDGFLAKNYPGREAEMFEKLAQSQPIGRMGTPEEVANLALFLCSEEAGFITGCDFPLDGGFIRLKPE